MDPTPSLAQRRSDRALENDRLLRGLFTATVGSGDDPREGQGLALVAVGGYGRSELSPASDLDVVLLHDPSVPEERVREVAEAIWYPLWDRGVALDHSVRDTVQMREAAMHDHRAATGMLDARTVAGDAGLVLALRSEVLADWRRDARRRLAEVRLARDARIERAGWLAHSAVPDLKESGGGLRDGVMMRALVATWLVDVPHGESEGLRSALLDVRDALHEVSGRRLEKLDADHIVDVARFLDRDPEELELSTRNIGRRLAHLAALAWRRVDDVLEARRTTITTSGPAVAPLAEGVGRLDDEVIVMRDADPRRRPRGRPACGSRRRRGPGCRSDRAPPRTSRPRSASCRCRGRRAPPARWSTCSRPARAWCRCGTSSTTPAWSTTGCRSGPTSACADRRRRCTATPSTGTASRRA